MFFRRQPSMAELVTQSLLQEHKNTDFGRRYGWWLCFRGKRVADLNYRRWDEAGQFWHEYSVFVFDPSFAEIGFDPNRWCRDDVTLESRYVEGFHVANFLMAPREDNVVMIRAAHVPEEEFLRMARQFHPIPAGAAAS